MAHVRLSSEAEQDLVETWLFIAEDSPKNADRFLDRLAATAERLAELRDMGRHRPELAEDIKYRDHPDGIELVRVLHGSRDIDALF